MKKALIILAIIIFACILIFTKAHEIILLIFTLFIFLFIWPIIYLLGFPFFITVKFIDILYPALIFSALTSAVTSTIIRYITKIKIRFILLIACLLFSFIYYPTAKYVAEDYINKVAVEKYSLKPNTVNINLARWKITERYYSIGGGNEGRLGSSHATIFINGCYRNWSFFKRDFIKSDHCKK